MKELTDYERSLIERFRSSLFDTYEDWDEGLIDPSHPEYPAVMAILLPPRRRQKKARPEKTATQERLEI